MKREMPRKPVCPRCGRADTRRSMHRGLIDAVAAVILLAPFRCRRCLTRFFRFRNSWAKFALLAGLCVVGVVVATGYRVVKQYRLRPRTERLSEVLFHLAGFAPRFRSRPAVAAISAERWSDSGHRLRTSKRYARKAISSAVNRSSEWMDENCQGCSHSGIAD